MILQSNPNLARNCSLITEWQRNSISYCIFNNVEHEVIENGQLDLFYDLEDYTKQEFSLLIKNEELFGFSFEKHIILLNSPIFTLFPSELFDPSKQHEILGFNQHPPKGQIEIANVQLEDPNYKLIFGYPKQLKEVGEDQFLKVRLNHFLEGYLNYLGKIEKTTRQVFIHVNSNDFWITCFKSDVLHLCNSFDFEAPEDFIYKVLNVFQQMQLNPDQVPLVLSGSITAEDETYNLLGQYIRKITFLLAPKSLKYKAKDDQKHHYYLGQYTALL